MKKAKPQQCLEFGPLRKNVRPVAREKASAATTVGRVDVQHIAAIATPDYALDLRVFLRPNHFTDGEFHLSNGNIQVTNLRS